MSNNPPVIKMYQVNGNVFRQQKITLLINNMQANIPEESLVLTVKLLSSMYTPSIAVVGKQKDTPPKIDKSILYSSHLHHWYNPKAINAHNETAIADKKILTFIGIK